MYVFQEVIVFHLNILSPLVKKKGWQNVNIMEDGYIDILLFSTFKRDLLHLFKR